MDEAEWKQEGERIIMKAAMDAGATAEMIEIEWKAGRIVVTVKAEEVFMSADFHESEYVEEELEFDGDDDGEGGEDFDDFVEGEEDEENFDDLGDDDMEDFDEDETDMDMDIDMDDCVEVDSSGGSGVDVVSLARAINQAFDEEGEGSVGYNIAVHHSVEVTTPGATDELSGVMFESYKGFDVVVEYQDTKTNKMKKIEGKLVERDDEFTRINEKGRMRKFPNELVDSVKLPKAKSEKGVGGASKKKSSKKKKKK